jgi:predicted glycogen debranching enzyme
MEDPMLPRIPDESAEWLETDGLGGFASGTVRGPRTRRYHALLLAAATPPVDRFVLVNGIEASVETAGGVFPLSSQRYAPDTIHPDGAGRIVRFDADPWPRWEFRLEDGTRIEHEILAVHGAPLVLLSWKGIGRMNAGTRLSVRLLISGRDFHALHHENAAFRFDALDRKTGQLCWRPYDGIPGILAFTEAEYEHRPEWYRNFLYAEERARGLDCVEDLASPGIFRWDLSAGEAFLVLGATTLDLDAWLASQAGRLSPVAIRDAERRRRERFPSPIHRAADAYLVRRGGGRTIIAGYPWFGDWGRDTFISLRGLCLAAGRLDEAGQILREWAGAVSEGMLPNRFPDRGETPEFNSVDASLWYVIAVGEYRRAMKEAGRKISKEDETALCHAVDEILRGYAHGTRYGIRLDEDRLLAAGVPGVQLTWMDARVGDRVITPRIGKPVEIQSLWLNALRIAESWAPEWAAIREKGERSFGEKFWNEERGCLFDVVDADHRPGNHDPTFRPNQIFAVGGLPECLLPPDRARRVVEAVEAELLTPLGLRSLAPSEPGYAPRYEGDPGTRDSVYHQGTVWPWLIGPFVEAWLRIRSGSPEAKREARRRFLEPLRAHLGKAGIGHVSEIADAEPPHTPRGCPFQAWSMGELLRLSEAILGKEVESGSSRAETRRAKKPDGRAGDGSPRSKKPLSPTGKPASRAVTGSARSKKPVAPAGASGSRAGGGRKKSRSRGSIVEPSDG